MKKALAIALLTLTGALQAEEAPVQPAAFSGSRSGPSFPTGWTLNILPGIPRATRFDLVRDEGKTVLRAVSDDAAATLTYKLRVDTAQTPLLAWRWKVSRALENADLGSKAGDDYAARVYVLFDYPVEKLPVTDRVGMALARTLYGQEVPAAALCYVWDNRHRVGMSAWSAYTDRVRMIVVESGSDHVGQWRQEQRDVAADFRAAFGEEPPPVSGVALAADTDNTEESVTAWFGDLAFLSPSSTAASSTP